MSNVNNILMEYLKAVPATPATKYDILEIGCGRGGDIMKFYYISIEIILVTMKYFLAQGK